MKRLVLLLWACSVSLMSFDAMAYENRDMLMNLYRKTGNVFSMNGEWVPWPACSDREAWDRLVGTAKGRIVSVGEKYLDYEWKTIPATAYLEYERTGDRTAMQSLYEANRKAINALMMAELAEGEGRFVDQLANGVWLSCQMPSWVLSAHLVRQSTRRSLPDPRESIIDLASAGYAATIALSYHFFKDRFDAMDPSISYCIEASIKEKVLDPFLNKDKWKANWWMAMDWEPGILVNNWNPWCNANTLLCVLLMETDRERFDEAISLSLHSADQFINYVKGDGACEEGPAYWDAAAGKLYDYLQTLYYASSGKFSIFDNRQVKDMGEYIVRSYIGDKWVVNFADASARLSLEPTLIWRYGKAVGSGMMKDFACYLCGDSGKGQFVSPRPVIWNDSFRSLESVVSVREMSEALDSLNRLVSDSSFESVLSGLVGNVPVCTWYPETEFAYFRNRSGWFAAAKGGFNNESHNHNDVGTFLLYIDNVPVFVDAGVGTYTKKTFSHERYSIWSMQSDWHNLPSINGTSQIFGAEFKAGDVVCDMNRRMFSADISSAYTDAASCRRWGRSYRLKDDSFEIEDRYELDRRVLADTLNFLVQGEVYLPGETTSDGVLVKDGDVLVVNGKVSVRMSFPKSMNPEVVTKELADPRLTGIWGTSLRRISFTVSDDAPLKGRYKFVVTRL